MLVVGSIRYGLPSAYDRPCIVYLYILDSVVACTISGEVYRRPRCLPLGDKPCLIHIGAVYKRAVYVVELPATRSTPQVIYVLACILVVVAVDIDEVVEVDVL